MNFECAHCGKPLDRIQSIESEIGEVWHEKTEYMCTNSQCRYGSVMVHESSGRVQKRGYVTLQMLQKKEAPKNWFRKMFPEKEKQLAARPSR